MYVFGAVWMTEWEADHHANAANHAAKLICFVLRKRLGCHRP